MKKLRKIAKKKNKFLKGWNTDKKLNKKSLKTKKRIKYQGNQKKMMLKNYHKQKDRIMILKR